jgi:hypothetical protein
METLRQKIKELSQSHSTCATIVLPQLTMCAKLLHDCDFENTVLPLVREIEVPTDCSLQRFAEALGQMAAEIGENPSTSSLSDGLYAIHAYMDCAVRVLNRFAQRHTPVHAFLFENDAGALAKVKRIHRDCVVHWRPRWLVSNMEAEIAQLPKGAIWIQQTADGEFLSGVVMVAAASE